jgi:NAD-dependent SIR2 family protein deacetylase
MRTKTSDEGDERQPRRKLAVFLGAGASVPLGFCVTDGIFPQIVRRLRESRLFGDGYQIYHQPLRDFLGAIGARYGEPGTYLPSITELLSLVDHFIGAKRSPWENCSPRALRRFRKILVAGIAEVLYHARKRTRKEKLAIRPWTDWIGRVVRGTTPGVDVAFITTNYDRTLERVIWAQLEDDEIPEIDFGVQWYWADEHECLERVPNKPRFGLYKLHGSLDALICPKCGRYYLSRWDNYLVPLMDKKEKSTCHCGHHPLDYTLIAPSLVRRAPHPRMKDIWKRASAFMRDAEDWIIAGYSMPAEDLLVKELLLNGLHKRRSPLNVEIVQKHGRSDVADRYKFYFMPHCNVRIIGGGLERYVGLKKSIFKGVA